MVILKFISLLKLNKPFFFNLNYKLIPIITNLEKLGFIYTQYNPFTNFIYIKDININSILLISKPSRAIKTGTPPYTYKIGNFFINKNKELVLYVN